MTVHYIKTELDPKIHKTSKAAQIKEHNTSKEACTNQGTHYTSKAAQDTQYLKSNTNQDA